MKKICIITGGANGIGRCIAEKLIEEKNVVIVIDTDDVSGLKMKDRYSPAHFCFYSGDISKKEVLEDFAEKVVQKFPKIDVLIHNACINRGGLETCSYDDFNTVLHIGVTAPFYLTKLLLPYFKKNASIVNIASTRAFMSQRNTESYTAAKGGIAALTHAMAVSLSGKARVNSISPGWIDTGAYQTEEIYDSCFSESDMRQHPSGRVGIPEDIAEMVKFLISEKAGFINGENIMIDGGMTKQMIYHGDEGWTYQKEKK